MGALAGRTVDGPAQPAASHLQLRAERSGSGDGRVCRVAFSVADAAGATCTGMVVVGVPHANGGTAVDSGGVFDSTKP